MANKDLIQVTKISNSTSLKIFNAVCKNKPTASLIFSPLSAQIVLALIHSGASDSTAAEIANLIFDKDIKGNIPYIGYHFLLGDLKKAACDIAIKLYADKSVNLKDNFNSEAEKSFHTHFEKTNLADHAAIAKQFNEWMQKEIKINIEKIAFTDAELKEATKLFIIGVAHAHQNWKDPFSFGATYEDNFYVTEKNTIEIEMMFKSGRYKFMEHSGLNAKILEMPFENNNLMMYFLLPEPPNDLIHLEEAVSNIDIITEINKMPLLNVDVTLPKVEIFSTIEFKQIFHSMGITKAFDKEANLSGMSETSTPFNNFIQKAYIYIDEKGCDGVVKSAVTTNAPQQHSNAIDDDDEDCEQFKAIRPFMYFMTKSDGQQKLIIYTGNFTGKRK